MADDPIEEAIDHFSAGFAQGVKPKQGRIQSDLKGKAILDWMAGLKAGEEARTLAICEYRRHLLDQASWPLSPAQIADGQTSRHCDDYIHDHKQPLCLRAFLLRQRVPAVDGHLMELAGFHPQLFATCKGKRVKVTMASRFGDVGITLALDAVNGYDRRVPIASLSDFGDKP